jgi:hypothetical protein
VAALVQLQGLGQVGGRQPAGRAAADDQDASLEVIETRLVESSATGVDLDAVAPVLVLLVGLGT